MLRVAHVLNRPGRGGVPRVVDALIRHCDRDRIAPHVFYLKGDAETPLRNDVPVRMAQSASKAAALVDLVAFLEEYRIDILHTHSYRPNLYARMAGAVLRPRGLRVVAHYHNDYSDKWDHATCTVERRLAEVTDAGLAVSTAVAAHVAEEVGLVCELAVNGIDRDRVTGGNRQAGRAALGIGRGAGVVGLVGRICHQKGVDTFVDAALCALPDRPDLHFAVIGDVEDPALHARLEARIGAAGLMDRVHFAGHREDMADMLAALDLLAAPSRWEGFGLMLVEAMAAGVPVLGSDVGGIPDVVGKAGALVAPDDPGLLAEAILGLMDDPIERGRMREAGMIHAGQFAWDRTAQSAERVYEKITRPR